MPFMFELESLDGKPAGTLGVAETSWVPGDGVFVRPGERLLIRQVLAPTRDGFAGRWRVEPLIRP